jgi:hypothetical protein
VYDPAIVALHETAAVPDVVILPGVIDPHVRPAGTVSVNDTGPVKPLTGAKVIVDVADTPTTAAVGDEAVSVKSVTVKLEAVV